MRPTNGRRNPRSISTVLIPLDARCEGVSATLTEKECDAGADSEEATESAGGRSAGGAFANAEQLRGNAHGTAEQVGVDAIRLTQSAQARELIAKLLVGECDLILLGLAGKGLRLLASELSGELRSAGRVVSGRQTISGALAQGIERSICSAHTLLSDGRLLGGRVAGTREQAVNRWQ